MTRIGSPALAACLAFALAGCDVDKLLEQSLCSDPALTPTLVGTWSWASDSSTIALWITADAPAVAGTGRYWVRRDSAGSVRYACGEGAVSGTYRHPAVHLVLASPWGNARLDGNLVQLNQSHLCGGDTALVGTLQPVAAALPFVAQPRAISLASEWASWGAACPASARALPGRYGTAATYSRSPRE